MKIDGFDMLNDELYDLNSNLDLDAYIDPLNYDNHFARSPEWFYNMNEYAAPGSWSNAFGM
jgi:hypothetical protein